MDAGDIGLGEGGIGFGYGVGESYGAGCVFEDYGFKAQCLAVEGGVTDAEVVGQACYVDGLDGSFAKVAGEAGEGLVVVFKEGRSSCRSGGGSLCGE